MWFLWGLITFLIVIFSSSQIVSYVVCFLRYPEMMENMQCSNKRLIIGGLILHTFIHLIWIVLICVIPIITKYWWVCLVVAIIGLSIGISNVRTDTTLKQNFAKLTGFENRNKMKNELDTITTNYQKLIKANSQKLKNEKSDEKTLTNHNQNLTNWELSHEDAQQSLQRKKEHSLENLVDFIRKAKTDRKYLKDVAETLIYMYSDDVAIYATCNNKVFSLVDYSNDSYMPIFTDETLIDKSFKPVKQVGTREMFENFYKGFDNQIFNGIIINPLSNSTIVFPKNAVDGLYLDLMFEVPWNKK